MPTTDTSQTTRTKILAGKELAKYHRLNPYSPQGGRYPFLQTDLVYENVGKILGGCCGILSASSPAPAPSGGYTLTYNSGAGGSGTPPAPTTSYSAGTSIAILGNTFTNLLPGGRLFGGWNTTISGGSGIYYPATSTLTMPYVDTILYAQWYDLSGTNYTVAYNANGGTGSVPATVSYKSGQGVGISGKPDSLVNGSLTFYGWNTAANGLGPAYPVTSNGFTMPAENVILYAQWVDTSATQYTLTYNGMGNTDGIPPANTTYPDGAGASVAGQVVAKTGFTFLGWNTDEDGIGANYSTGQSILMNSNKSLYAQWAPGSVVKNCGGGTGSNQYIFYYYPYSQIIASTDTITIYTTCIVGSKSSNVGSGAAPEELISITGKVVITAATITINTNTTYLDSLKDYNYAYTITNGSGVTYWPFGETITSVTFPSLISVNSAAGSATYGISTRRCINGCGLSGTGSGSGSTFTSFNFFNQGVTLNYSNGTNTIFVSSPNNSVRTENSGSTWIQTPNSLYPYNYGSLTPRSSAVLTTITIIPSTASEYVYPPLPNYTVEYNGNGATDGNIPVPVYMSPYTATTSITISGNTGLLIKSTAPSTFSRWNTAADGSGTNYGPGYTTTYAGGASITLYAIWV